MSWFRRTRESERLLAEERVVLGATELLCEAMERRGVTRTELASLLGVTPSEVTQRLSGRRNLSLRSFAAMLHELDFGIEGRLIDRAVRDVPMPLHGRRMDWPSGASDYTTATGVPVRLVNGSIAS